MYFRLYEKNQNAPILPKSMHSDILDLKQTMPDLFFTIEDKKLPFSKSNKKREKTGCSSFYAQIVSNNQLQS